MLKALVIDDEDMTRDILLNFLPWLEIGVESVCEANNGVNALELASTFVPDIVLCDVRMPKMDGIEFSTHLYELLPDCKIIFLSAYTDKEYLKSAIKLKAVSYIEKPIVLDEITEVLKQAVAECLKRKSILLQNRQSMFQNICKSLTIGHIDMKNILNSVKELNINFPENGQYISCVIQIYPFEGGSLEKLTNTTYSILKTILESFENDYLSTIKGEGYILCHFNTGNSIDVDILQNKLLEFMNKFITDLEHMCKIYIALGNEVTELKNVYLSYQSAVVTLQKHFFYGYNKIISYSIDTSSPYILDESSLSSFSDYLKLNKKNEAILTIKRAVNNIRNHTNTNPDSIREIFHKFIFILSTFAEKMNIPFSKDNSEFKFIRLTNAVTLNELEEITLNLINYLFSDLENTDIHLDLIAKITKILNENYQDKNLSIEFIAKKLYLTPNYLSSLFKSSTGKTISQYLTDIRVEKAMELLKNTDNKLYNIGKMVGYDDGRYFTKVFEKATGIKPKEYRGLRND